MSANTVKLQAPQGTTQISVEQQVFDVAPDGTVTVPFPFVERLKGHGFVPASTRIQLVGGGSLSPAEQSETIRRAGILNPTPVIQTGSRQEDEEGQRAAEEANHQDEQK